MIFAREVSDTLTSLVKKIEAQTAINSDKRMGSFVVFLSESESLKEQLTALAKKAELDKCILSVDKAEGPQGYGVAKDADITVVLYRKQVVEANFAFRKGELNEAALAAIVGDLPRILK
jgi:hypothetical protein